MRVLVLLLALPALAACSLSQEELDQIADYRQRAAQYYDVNDLNRAEQQARRGLEIDPESPELRHLLGRTLLKKGDPMSVQLAGLELAMAHDLDPDFRTAYSLGEYHLRHAELLLGSALVLEQKRAEIDASEADVRSSMQTDIDGRRAKAEGHLEDSLALIETALTERSEWVEALQHKASILAHMGRDQESLVAINRLTEVLRRSRHSKNARLTTELFSVPEEDFWRDSLIRDIAWEVEARGLAASILMNDERWAEAEEELTEILKLAPERAPEYYNRGLARYRQGKLAAAADDMRRFLGKTGLPRESPQIERALGILEEFEGGSGLAVPTAADG